MAVRRGLEKGTEGTLALTPVGSPHPALLPNGSPDVSWVTVSTQPVCLALCTPMNATAWLQAGLPVWPPQASR